MYSSSSDCRNRMDGTHMLSYPVQCSPNETAFHNMQERTVLWLEVACHVAACSLMCPRICDCSHQNTYCTLQQSYYSTVEYCIVLNGKACFWRNSATVVVQAILWHLPNSSVQLCMTSHTVAESIQHSLISVHNGRHDNLYDFERKKLELFWI